MKVAIVGSRNFPAPEKVQVAIDYLMENSPGWTLVTGGATGVDTWAEAAARAQGVSVEVFQADWEGLGRVAGFVRNREIIARVNLVIAFWDGKSSGTKHSIDMAKAQGKACWVVGP
jgi:predicted Rossmann fold nucleotide-binding protein DprA/Smf involved in DNA uptake